MAGRRTDLTGQVFGEWEVLSRSEEKAKDGRYKYICKCSCGAIKPVDGRHLKNKTSQSCGCQAREKVGERSRTHGMTDSPAYKSWAGMKQRCTNPTIPEWSNYGGRGITYPASWETFEGFLADMGEPPTGFTLDRVDVNGPYCKDNCRWASNAVQSHNRRKRVYKNSTNPSRFIGVTWHKRRKRWRVKLVFEGVVIVDKLMDDDIEAAKLYDNLSYKYYGDRPNDKILESLRQGLAQHTERDNLLTNT